MHIKFVLFIIQEQNNLATDVFYLPHNVVEKRCPSVCITNHLLYMHLLCITHSLLKTLEHRYLPHGESVAY